MKYNPSVFNRELKKIYEIVPQSPTGYNPLVFHRELKTIYGIVPQSPTESPTRYNPSVFHRELKNIYRIMPQSPTALPTYITNRVTDRLRTSRSTCMSDACPLAQVSMDRKVWRDFRTFLVRISINFQQNYRRNLMPPTTINVRR
jgi:hypothetical protein